jgi:(2Fe-2S) ferredoxin
VRPRDACSPQEPTTAATEAPQPASRTTQSLRPQASPAGCSLVVCHGCCCARDGKARSQEALILLAGLRDVCGPDIPIVTSDCLGPCSYSDVVVVRPSRAARNRGARPTWLGWMRHQEAFDQVALWASLGGPGNQPLPAALALHSFSPPAEQPSRKRGRQAKPRRQAG